jgi:hypothetical protein
MTTTLEKLEKAFAETPIDISDQHVLKELEKFFKPSETRAEVCEGKVFKDGKRRVGAAPKCNRDISKSRFDLQEMARTQVTIAGDRVSLRKVRIDAA